MSISEEFNRLIARAYYESALENINMRNATDILEAIRNSLVEGLNYFEVWEIIDQYIGKTEKDNLQKVFIKFRNRFIQQILTSEVARLREAFKDNIEYGWTEWQRTYVDALTYFRIGNFCLALSKERFQFPAGTESIMEKISKSTKYASHARWSEAYDMFIYLAEQEFISNVQRAKMYVTAAEIQLYHLLNLDVAKDLLQRGEELAPGESRVICGWGEYWLQKNEFDTAKEYFMEVIRQYPLKPLGYTSMGDCYERKNELDVAEEWYLESIKKSSGEYMGYISLLRLYGRPEMLETHESNLLPLLKRAIAVDPTGEYNAYIAMGYIYKQSKQYEKAHNWYDKAIELDDTRLDGYFSKGMVHIDEKNYEHARVAFQKAIEVAPEAFDGYSGMAWLLELQEKWEDALYWHDQSLQHRPSWEGRIRGKLGEIKWKLKEYEKAEEELIKALRCEPGNQSVLNTLHYLANDYYQIAENPEGALRVYDKIREIKGKTYEANYYNRVGNLKYYLDDFQAAADAYKKAAAIEPSEAVYHSNLADASKQLKDWEKAIYEYKSALEIEPNNVYRHSSLADAYIDSGDWEKAVYEYKKALEIEPSNTNISSKLDEARFGLCFGKKFLERLPRVNPIEVETAGNLIPYIESKKSETDELNPILGNLIANMREDIYKTIGVRLPGIRFRGNLDLPKDNYSIFINEIPIATGTISEVKRLFPGTEEELKSLGIYGEQTDNPFTGCKAFWISKKDWEKVEQSGQALWGVIEYMVKHLEGITRRNLSIFFGHQEVMNSIQDKLPGIYGQIKEYPEDLSVVTFVIRNLLNEEVPVVELEKIINRFDQLKNSGKDLFTVVEEIRSIPEVCRVLPGNNDQYSLYSLGRRFEEEVERSICRDEGQPFLAMEPGRVRDTLTAVRGSVGFKQHVAILVEKAELRPYVRELVELEFPTVPVLSRKELLPTLESKIAGDIEIRTDLWTHRSRRI